MHRIIVFVLKSEFSLVYLSSAVAVWLLFHMWTSLISYLLLHSLLYIALTFCTYPFSLSSWLSSHHFPWSPLVPQIYSNVNKLLYKYSFCGTSLSSHFLNLILAFGIQLPLVPFWLMAIHSPMSFCLQVVSWISILPILNYYFYS